MANYHNYLTNGQGTPLKAVLVRLINTSGKIVDTTTTNKYGFYEFTNVTQGTYTISFYGNELTEYDWLYNVQIIDAEDILTSGVAGADGNDAIFLKVDSFDDSPLMFVVDGGGSYSPATITLEARLHQAGELTQLDISGDTCLWYMGGDLVQAGLAASTYYDTLTVIPEQVSGISLVRCEVVHDSITYKDTRTVFDVEDGATGQAGPAGAGSYFATITTSGGLTFKSTDGGVTYTPENSVATGKLWFEGMYCPPSDDLTFTWKIDNRQIKSGTGAPYSTQTITPQMVSGVALVTCEIVSGVGTGPFTAQQSFTDIVDGTDFYAVITSPNGSVFLHDSDDTYLFDSLTFSGTLYRGGTELTTDVTYVWKLGGNVVAGETNRGIEIPNGDVDISAPLKCEITYAGNGGVYSDEVTIYDVLDPGYTYLPLIVTVSGVTSVDGDPGALHLESKLYKAGNEIDDADITYQWYDSGGAQIGDDTAVHIVSTPITSSYSCDMTYHGTNPFGQATDYGPFTSYVSTTSIESSRYVTILPNKMPVFVSGLGGYTPEEIVLSGIFYLGGVETAVDSGNYVWSIGGVQHEADVTATTITPNDIQGNGVVTCEITYGGTPYTGIIGIVDVSDGVDGTDGSDGVAGDPAIYLIPYAPSGLILQYEPHITQIPEIVVFAYLYIGGELQETSVDYDWYLDGVPYPDPVAFPLYNENYVTIGPGDVYARSRLSCTATYDSTQYYFPNALDIEDTSDPAYFWTIDPAIRMESGFGEISEVTDHYGFTPLAKGSLTFGDIYVYSGLVKNIKLEYSEKDADSFSEIANFNVNLISGNTYSDLTYEFGNVPVPSPVPSDDWGHYDFRASFYNAIGEQALIGSGTNTYHYATFGDIQFTGQSYYRYTVPELQLSDDGGTTWVAWSPHERQLHQLRHNQILLKWRDLSAVLSDYTFGTSAPYLEDWDGNTITSSTTLTAEQCHNIKKFVVLGKVYEDLGRFYTHTGAAPTYSSEWYKIAGTNTATGIPDDGPGADPSAKDGECQFTWTVLQEINVTPATSYTDTNHYQYATVTLPYGRVMSIHVYMVVDYAPIKKYPDNEGDTIQFAIDNEMLPGGGR